MNTNLHELFLRLVRLGIGHTDKSGFKFQDSGLKSVDWEELQALAERQGLLAVVTDGMDYLKTHGEDGSMELPPKPVMLQFIGQTLQIEQRNQAMNEFVD